MTQDAAGATEVRAENTPTPSRALLRDAAAVLGVSVALGLVGAVLWWLLVDPAEFTVGPGGGLGMGEVELGKRFNDDGWFVVIGAIAGLLSGAALTWWRSRDPLLTVLLVLVGAVAGVALMTVVGGWLGPAAPSSGSAGADGAVPVPLEVTGFVCYLVWPITALVGALLVLWSPAPAPPTAPTAPPDPVASAAPPARHGDPGSADSPDGSASTR